MSTLSRLVQPVRRMAGALGLPVELANPFATHRAILHAPDFPVVLLFTEKAGCTSLTKWFLFHVDKLDEALQYHRWVHKYRKDIFCHRSGYGREALRLIVSRAKPVVKLVRDPYARAASSFLHTLNGAQGKNSKRWAGEFVSAARRHSGKPASSVPAMSFRDFVQMVSVTGTERGQINGHVARQYTAGETGYIHRIIKLERFAEEVRSIEAEYGLPEAPLEIITASKHHRSTRQHPSAPGECMADFEITTEQVRKGDIPAYDTLYDDECRRLVRQAFAADFEAYGYDVEQQPAIGPVLPLATSLRPRA